MKVLLIIFGLIEFLLRLIFTLCIGIITLGLLFIFGSVSIDDIINPVLWKKI